MFLQFSIDLFLFWYVLVQIAELFCLLLNIFRVSGVIQKIFTLDSLIRVMELIGLYLSAFRTTLFY